MTFNLENIPCFGVAGNFTGHLEQAGEAKDFVNVKTKEVNAPKALFPTYIPFAKQNVPSYLLTFPFDSRRIIFPENEQKIQIEPECGIICNVKWNDGKAVEITPVAFGASNDCSIRKEGASKISQKKNWGPSSKGLSDNLIEIDSFDENGKIDGYRIASFLVRDGNVIDYGEDSPVSGYSYMYGKLLEWLKDKLNFQKNEGPAEEINVYLNEAGCPEQIFISVGATRYTEFGTVNFLKAGDETAVVLYQQDKYTHSEIAQLVKAKDFSDRNISFLYESIL